MAWQISDGSFKGVKFHVATPSRSAQYGITSQEVTWERRLQVSEKPLVDGASVEDFGRKPRTFAVEVIFFGQDYRDDVAKFENTLNPASPGKNDTGVLILPDMPDAVYAKYHRHVRRTQTESVTILSVTWIEDFTGTIALTTQQTTAQTAALLAAGDTAKALPTISDKLLAVASAADAASAALTNNAFTKGLKSLETQVVNSRLALNSILNIPKNLRTQVVSTINRMQLELSTLKDAVQGILHFTDLLNLAGAVGTATRVNSGAGAIDFINVDAPTTTVVDGVGTVVTPTKIIPPVASYPAAAVDLAKSAAVIQSGSTELEETSSGNTGDFSTTSLILINNIKDLVQILKAQSTTQVMTTMLTSLPEVIFENGKSVTNLDYYRGLNPDIPDILNVPAYTVVNL